jgi:hypothetical protein
MITDVGKNEEEESVTLRCGASAPNFYSSRAQTK